MNSQFKLTFRYYWPQALWASHKLYFLMNHLGLPASWKLDVNGSKISRDLLKIRLKSKLKMKILISICFNGKGKNTHWDITFHCKIRWRQQQEFVRVSRLRQRESNIHRYKRRSSADIIIITVLCVSSRSSNGLQSWPKRGTRNILTVYQDFAVNHRRKWMFEQRI